MTVFTPLALGSYWGLLLVIPLIPLLAWRLLDEERYLARNLPGYSRILRAHALPADPVRLVTQAISPPAGLCAPS